MQLCIEFVSICFAMLLLFLEQQTAGVYLFGMSLLGLLILGLSFGKSVFVNALRLHLSDLMHKHLIL
jgi:hypothetical protein